MLDDGERRQRLRSQRKLEQLLGTVPIVCSTPTKAKNTPGDLDVDAGRPRTVLVPRRPAPIPESPPSPAESRSSSPTPSTASASPPKARRGMAKLARRLGENVPARMLFARGPRAARAPESAPAALPASGWHASRVLVDARPRTGAAAPLPWLDYLDSIGVGPSSGGGPSPGASPGAPRPAPRVHVDPRPRTGDAAPLAWLDYLDSIGVGPNSGGGPSPRASLRGPHKRGSYQYAAAADRRASLTAADKRASVVLSPMDRRASVRISVDRRGSYMSVRDSFVFEPDALATSSPARTSFLDLDDASSPPASPSPFRRLTVGGALSALPPLDADLHALLGLGGALPGTPGPGTPGSFGPPSTPAGADDELEAEGSPLEVDTTPRERAAALARLEASPASPSANADALCRLENRRSGVDERRTENRRSVLDERRTERRRSGLDYKRASIRDDKKAEHRRSVVDVRRAEHRRSALLEQGEWAGIDLPSAPTDPPRIVPSPSRAPADLSALGFIMLDESDASVVRRILDDGIGDDSREDGRWAYRM